ncbi:hypothetical protein QBC40DRAFT_183447, partial [Triangularia verruculosa]
EEYTLLLFEDIRRELLIINLIKKESRLIFFIASYLGGIILAKALVNAGNEYLPLKRAIDSIIFLITPF